MGLSANLEVSCGHGGGASFVMRYRQPAAYTAIDQNPKAITCCREMHSSLGIHFQIGDAQTLDFPPDHFDAVLNVEASHCYPRQGDFFRSVYRVLRPGVFILPVGEGLIVIPLWYHTSTPTPFVKIV